MEELNHLDKEETGFQPLATPKLKMIFLFGNILGKTFLKIYVCTIFVVVSAEKLRLRAN